MAVDKDESELQLELALAAQARDLVDSFTKPHDNDDDDDFGIAYDTETGVEIDMRPPFVKIAMIEREYEQAIQMGMLRDAVRLLVARAHLTQLTYGICHVRLAQAYLTAAKGYMDLLGWYQQAFQHARESQRIYKQLSHEGNKDSDTLKLGVDVYYVLGVCLTQLDDLEQAEKLLRKALDKDAAKTSSGKAATLRMTDAQRDMHHALGICQMKQKKHAEARESLGIVKTALIKVAKEDKGKEEQLRLVDRDIAECLQHEEQFVDSIKTLQDIVQQLETEVGDDGAPLCEYLMMEYKCHMRSNNPYDAEPVLRRVLDIQIARLGQMDKDTVETQDELIHFLMRMEKFDEALLLLKKTKMAKVELFGPTSAAIADVYQSIGTIKLAQGDVKAAKKYLTTAVKRYSDARGKHGKKIREAKQLLSLIATPDDPDPPRNSMNSHRRTNSAARTRRTK